MQESEAYFYIAIVGILAGWTITITKIFFSSRCDLIECPCGLKIHRNVDLESNERTQANIINRDNSENV
jgi:hypothetical protein